jgi:hypothetical protein
MNDINYTYICYIFALFQKYELHKLYICQNYVCYITDLYHVHSNTADLLLAALSWLRVAIQQSFAP